MGTSLPSLLPEIVCGIVCRPDCWRTWRLCMVFARGCARGFLFVVSALCGLLAWNRPACRPPAAKGPLCLRYLRDLRILRDASSLKTEATEWIRAAMPKCQAVPPSSSAVWPGLISLDWTGSCWAWLAVLPLSSFRFSETRCETVLPSGTGHAAGFLPVPSLMAATIQTCQK